MLAVLALCGSVWFRESVLALWSGGPQKTGRLAETKMLGLQIAPDLVADQKKVHDAQDAGVRCGAVGPSVQENRAGSEKANPIHQVLTWSHQVSRIRAAGGEEDGVIPKIPKERGIVERKTGAGEGMEIGRSLSSRGAKRRCAVSPAKPQFPYKVEPPGGGLPRDYSPHAPFPSHAVFLCVSRCP